MTETRPDMEIVWEMYDKYIMADFVHAHDDFWGVWQAVLVEATIENPNESMGNRQYFAQVKFWKRLYGEMNDPPVKIPTLPSNSGKIFASLPQPISSPKADEVHQKSFPQTQRRSLQVYPVHITSGVR